MLFNAYHLLKLLNNTPHKTPDIIGFKKQLQLTSKLCYAAFHNSNNIFLKHYFLKKRCINGLLKLEEIPF